MKRSQEDLLLAKNLKGLPASKDLVLGGDLFYWPPGHTVAVSKDAEIILFSPQQEHCAVVDHLRKQLVG